MHKLVNYLGCVVCHGAGAPDFDEVLLKVESLRAGVENPFELEIQGGVGDDVAADPDLLALRHAVHLDLVRLAKRFV